MPAAPDNLLAQLLNSPNREWMKDAACAKLPLSITERMKMFFLDNNFPSRHAKAVCAGCPVRVPCRQYARDTDTQYGVWGAEVLKRYDDPADPVDEFDEPVRYEELEPPFQPVFARACPSCGSLGHPHHWPGCADAA